MLDSPICIVPHCPSKPGIWVAKSLRLMVRNNGLPLESVVAKWFERRYGVYPISKELYLMCVSELGSLPGGWN